MNTARTISTVLSYVLTVGLDSVPRSSLISILQLMIFILSGKIFAPSHLSQLILRRMQSRYLLFRSCLGIAVLLCGLLMMLLIRRLMLLFDHARGEFFIVVLKFINLLQVGYSGFLSCFRLLILMTIACCIVCSRVYYCIG